MDEREVILEAATSYYVQNETMAVIARRLGVSRSTVSRMLAAARESGLVEITVHNDHRSYNAIHHALNEEYGVVAHLVPVRDTATPLARLDAVARVAGHLVSRLLHDGAALGMAWGTTISAVADRLPARQLSGVHVVQLNGAANITTSGIDYTSDILGQAARAYDATAHYFPVPAFFDFPETKAALWRERTVQRVLELHEALDVAVFSVGAFQGELPSHVYSDAYLTRADVTELIRERVVGDVCTVFLREDGTYADIAINARASGPTPS